MRTAYDPLRHAHVESVQAGLADHIGRLAWPRERIENYRDRRLRALLVYAAQRSPFHARRLADLNLSGVSVADLGALPSMTKAQAQENWDSIVTIPGLHRDDVETILASQQRYSYSPGGFQVFSSGGSSGVRGVYVGDWQFFISAACLAWRTQALTERVAPRGRLGWPYWPQACRRTPARRCSTSRRSRACRPSSSRLATRSTMCVQQSRPRDPPISSATPRSSVNSPARRWRAPAIFTQFG